MKLASPRTIKELLAKYGVKPNKILGQNFLIDKNILKKIVDTADLTPLDIVLEVGPGIGTLTQELAKNAGRVIAIEKDKVMVEAMRETLAGLDNVKIIQGDALKIFNFQFSIFNQFPKSQFSNYKVVANIPYYLTSNLIRNLLENKNPPQEIILLIQKEVAQRICSKPPNMSLLAVSVQFYAEPKIISYVSKNCFLPAPKIDSAIIKITPRAPGSQKFLRARGSQEFFFKVVRAGFSQPRKQLAGNLSKKLKIERKKVNDWLLKNKINPAQRAETLSVGDWENLANSKKNAKMKYEI